MSSVWNLYVLELSDGSYYAGISTDVQRRLKVHSSGKGSKCVRAKLPCRLVFVGFPSETRREAQQVEAQFKKLKREDKEHVMDLFRRIAR